MSRYLIVMLGAALGGLARYVIGTFVMQRCSGRFPLGTLVVNISGCFLIGILMTWFTARGDPHPSLRLLLVTGVLGGYTTFSSFAWETLQTVDEGSHAVGFINVASSLILGMIAVWCGAWLGRR